MRRKFHRVQKGEGIFRNLRRIGNFLLFSNAILHEDWKELENYQGCSVYIRGDIYAIKTYCLIACIAYEDLRLRSCASSSAGALVRAGKASPRAPAIAKPP